MKLIGYARTNMPDEIGALDLEEQERGMAEYCRDKRYELVTVLTDQDEHEHPAAGLQQALAAQADGILITDPLVVAQDMNSFKAFSADLLNNNKHLLVILNDKHINPNNSDVRDELDQFFSPFIKEQL